MFAAAAVALAFLLLPIVAIFARVSPGELLAQFSRPVVKDALLVSLKTNVIAQALVLLLGTPTAYLLATRRFRGRSSRSTTRRFVSTSGALRASGATSTGS